MMGSQRKGEELVCEEIVDHLFIMWCKIWSRNSGLLASDKTKRRG